MSGRTIIVGPRLSPAEATAIRRMLGSPNQDHGLRTFQGTPSWLDKHFEDVVGAIDALTARFDQALRSGEDAVSAMAFDDVECRLIAAAMDHELYGLKNNALFLSRYGIDLRRASHLQTALRSERALVMHMLDITDGRLRSHIDQMRREAQTMRASRHAVYNGVDGLDLCPELNLLFDARQIAAGSYARTPVQGDVIRAWKAFGVDTQRAHQRLVEQRRAARGISRD